MGGDITCFSDGDGNGSTFEFRMQMRQTMAPYRMASFVPQANYNKPKPKLLSADNENKERGIVPVMAK